MNAERRWWKHLSLFPLLVAILVALWLLSVLTYAVLAPARERGKRRLCRSNLLSFGYISILYSTDFDGAFPPTPGHLYPGYICVGRAWVCPSAGNSTGIPDDPRFTKVDDEGRVLSWSSGEDIDGEFRRPNDTWYTPAKWGDTYTDYVYVSGLRESDPIGYVLAFDDEWNHDGDGVNVLFTAGTVEWMRDIKELHRLLAMQERELAAQGRKMKLLRPAWSSWPDPLADSPAGAQPWETWFSGWDLTVAAFGGVVAAALALIFHDVRRGRKQRTSG